MSSANAIIKINEVVEDMVNFNTFETGNGDFFANGFNSMAGMFMILLTPATSESEIIKDIQLMGGDPSDDKWLKDNASKFISFYRVQEKKNDIKTSEEQNELRMKIEREENTSSTIEALMKYAPTTQYNLVVTDPKYISHLQPGAIFETTAYDMY